MLPKHDLSASKALSPLLPSRVSSRAGIPLDPSLDIWTWTDGPARRRIDFRRYSDGYERFVLALKLALIPFYKGSSGAHVINLESAFHHLVDLTGDCPSGDFTPEHLSKFSAKLSASSLYRVGTLNGLIQKWVALKLPGMHPDCATYLAERKKPGNKKGEAVATRDPISGPFSELEFKALYSAVNAYYGRGEIPLWTVLLCRLLMACGGRISQYASLKIVDFDPNSLVLRLPQAKTREKHLRVRFLEFDISPQTGRLLSEHIVQLRDRGYVDTSPIFPADLVLVRGEKQQLRSSADPFFGHCDPQLLSMRFRITLEEIVPSTPRLDYAPLPVAPQRFRYTFGTRMAEEGASKVVIANRLGHVDLQNVDVYFSASPRIVENIDKALDPLLAPLARAFQGQLVEDEASSTQKGALGSRIIDFRVSTNPVGGCSQCGRGCAFAKPVSCYTCFRFEPFLDAPHEKVLDQLLAERDKGTDPRMAAINDESIRAVQEVIALCEQVRQQRSSGNEAVA